jgi:hypothetical protein
MPCYEMITTGKDIPSTNFIHSLRENSIEQVADEYEIYNINTGKQYYTDELQHAKLILEDVRPTTDFPDNWILKVITKY